MLLPCRLPLLFLLLLHALAAPLTEEEETKSVADSSSSPLPPVEESVTVDSTLTAEEVTEAPVDEATEETSEGREGDVPPQALPSPEALTNEGRDDSPLPSLLPSSTTESPIEIRLIDENNNQSQHDTPVETVLPVPPLSPVTPHHSHEHEEIPATEDSENLTASPLGASETEAEVPHNEAPATVPSEYDEKYKKVEYVSDNVPAPSEGLVQEEEEATTTPTPEETPAAPVSVEDEAAMQKIQLASMLAASARMPVGPFPDDVRDEDLPVLGNGDDEDSDDEPEPVEECLANRHLLGEEIVDRMQKQAERLSKLIRKLNKQQIQFCRQQTDDGNHVFPDAHSYSQCPLWREEKIVHYYKLMRITYCADYGKWPNGTRYQATYGAYLPLFETLYAFQKQ